MTSTRGGHRSYCANPETHSQVWKGVAVVTRSMRSDHGSRAARRSPSVRISRMRNPPESATPLKVVESVEARSAWGANSTHFAASTAKLNRKEIRLSLQITEFKGLLCSQEHKTHDGSPGTTSRWTPPGHFKCSINDRREQPWAAGFAAYCALEST